jgi:hypothetical protein
MLRRLMLYLGVSDSKADSMLAAGGGRASAAAAGAQPAPVRGWSAPAAAASW